MIKNKLKKLLSRFGMGSGLRLTPRAAIEKGISLKRLHLGCGNIHIPGWTNVDVIPTGATDIVCDITTLSGIPKRSASEIYSCHVLEHFALKEIPSILKRWYEVLEPNGTLRISVPDLDAITSIYQKNLAHFQIPGNQPWIALIYGGQKDQYDFHKTGFNFCWINHLLLKAGFTEVAKYPNFPHFIDGVNDNSLASAPFGEYISLNVIATKKC